MTGHGPIALQDERIRKSIARIYECGIVMSMRFATMYKWLNDLRGAFNDLSCFFNQRLIHPSSSIAKSLASQFSVLAAIMLRFSSTLSYSVIINIIINPQSIVKISQDILLI